MLADPISLVVALDTSQSAQGTIYLDDGDSFEYEKGDYVWRQLTLSETAAKKLRLTSSNLATGSTAGHTALEASASGSRWSETASGILVSDITILGISHKPTCLRSSLTGKSLAFEWYDGAAASSGKKKTGTFASKLVIKEAALSISADWSIDIETSGTACDVPPVLDPLAKLASPLCPPHHFRCENKGHFPGCVLLSRVNDGICDPECCDGSDEFDGKRQCNNHCTEAHAAYKKTREEEKRKFRVGSSLRDQYIKFGQKEKVNVEKALARLEEEVDKLEGLEQTARKHVQQAESVSQKDIERKKASALYRRIEQYQKAIQSLRLDLQESQDEVDQLATVLVDLRAGYDPNMQDMAVKGAVRSFEEWSKTHDYPIAGMEITEETATVQEDSSLPPRESFPDDDLKKMEQEDILTLLEGSGDVVSYTETDMAGELCVMCHNCPI